VIRVETSGGGGYGPPPRRPDELLAADLEDARVLPETPDGP
jgi:N-methylhydantoinase B/oxoprolinase/acetone carboxylase alpha subunit